MLICVQSSFSIFDHDATGRINVEELRHVLTAIGEVLTREQVHLIAYWFTFTLVVQVDEIIMDANPGADGTIDFNDFVALLTDSRGILAQHF